MRGVSAGIGIVLAVVAGLLISSLLIIQLSRIKPPSLDDIANIKLPEIPEEVSEVSFSDLTNTEADTTSTEIACAIGTKLRDNFASFGWNLRDESTAYTLLGEADKRRSLVGAGRFKISTNPATGQLWKFEDLPAETQEGLKRTCGESGELVQCGTAFLDEECITNNLANRKLGENFLCTGLKNAQVVAGGSPQNFGNDNCNKKAADGTDNCATTCPGGNSMISWKAPEGGAVGHFVTDADLSDGGWPPKQCEDGGVGCPAMYEWALLFKDDQQARNKGYEVVVGRVPEKQELGSKDMLTLADELAAPVADTERKPREITAGIALRDLRRVGIVEAQPESKVTLSEFATRFTQKLGQTGWTFEVQDCLFEEYCLASKVIIKQWRAAQDSVRGTYNLADSCGTKKEELRTIELRTNVGANDALLPDHKYLVVLSFWSVTHDTGFNRVVCTNQFGTCKACVEEDKTGQRCTINERLQRDCLGGDKEAFESINYYKRWQDYTLSVVDLGVV